MSRAGQVRSQGKLVEVKTGLWDQGVHSHFCDTSWNLPLDMEGLGSPFCCITEVDSISRSPGSNRCSKLEGLSTGHPQQHPHHQGEAQFQLAKGATSRSQPARRELKGLLKLSPKTNKQASKQANKQTNKQTNQQTNKQTSEKQTNKQARNTGSAKTWFHVVAQKIGKKKKQLSLEEHQKLPDRVDTGNFWSSQVVQTQEVTQVRNGFQEVGKDMDVSLGDPNWVSLVKIKIVQ